MRCCIYEYKQRRSYYFEPVKIVRDLVHEYINLTKFDLKLIDTVSFQRLKDIRQLTCQHVYVSARHTRFEHSLGVLELTRQAIKYLNKNGVIGMKSGDEYNPIITDNLQFNAALAALLHDIGHCPFSHLGETQFDSEEVRKRLYDLINENEQLKKCSDLCDAIGKKDAKKIGNVHEQLSCIIILENYFEILNNLSEKASNKTDTCDISTDFELILRGILGLEYHVSTQDLFEKYKVKNVIVRLINSDIFDMDKLDYIMRDSFHTAIGAPKIDTNRLFRNMYFNDKLSLVFTSKAVPALQNMINARDDLYMYVYNHHAVIFSDFLSTYISRKLAHNAAALMSIASPDADKKEINDKLDAYGISMSLGLVPERYLFSVDAIVKQNRSDSDWLSLLNFIHYNRQYAREEDTRKEMIHGEIRAIFNDKFIPVKKGIKPDEKKVADLSEKVFHAFELINQYKTRFFLKPWWKTVFEFNYFMNQNFKDDAIRTKLEKYICNGGEYSLDPAEFRSQIAKHVIFITDKLFTEKNPSLIEPLSDGDFYVIQRATRFFSPDMIKNLEVCLKSSEIIGPPTEVNYKTQEYYVKHLTKIIPQKDYSSIYAKEGFYIFSKQVSGKDDRQSKKHYSLIEQIFVFVSNALIQMGEQSFVEAFQPSKVEKESVNKEKVKNAENKSMEDIFAQFKHSVY